jgi:hypothetical protein
MRIQTITVTENGNSEGEPKKSTKKGEIFRYLYEAVRTGDDGINTQPNSIKAVDVDPMKKVNMSDAEDLSDIGKPESRIRLQKNKKEEEALASEMPDNGLETILKKDVEISMHPKECVVNSTAEE